MYLCTHMSVIILTYIILLIGKYEICLIMIGWIQNRDIVDRSRSTVIEGPINCVY